MSRPSPDSWRTISRLLDEALDLPPEARAAWLDALRAKDAAAAAAVAEWLGEFDEMESERFLADRTPPAAAASALVGLDVGAYTLVELIGQGGMGTVWLAKRRDGQFDQRVAVKLLNPGLVSAAPDRFSREAAILARLTHPNISRLLDAGVTASGAPYLILEYVAGEPIDAFCDARRLGVTERLYRFLDVLAPVAHAHANLIVHRDLKPANVLVTGEGHVKLLDFGIATLLGADGSGLVTATRERALTPAFAAPEQLTGDPVTTATDVYALGVLLFQLLTGRHPVIEPDTTPASLVEAVVHHDAPRASEAARRLDASDATAAEAVAAARETTPIALAHRLSGDLDTILQKALKRSPGERYASIAAFEDDIRRYLRRQPIAARPDTRGYRAHMFVVRHRVPVALAAVAILALLAGLAGTITQARRATSQAARADREAADARAQRDFARRQLVRAEAINDLNAFLIADAAPAGTPFTARELLDRAAEIVTKQGEDEGGTRIESLASIGGIYGNVGETTRAVALLEQAYGLAKSQDDPELLARTACGLGADVVKTGDIARARALVAEGLQALPADPVFGISRAQCAMDAVSVEIWAGDGDAAVRHAEAGQRAAGEAGAVSPLLALKLAMQRAEALRVADRTLEAKAAFEQAHAQLVALGRERTERAGTLLNNWALVLGNLGRAREAHDMFERSIAVSVAGGSDARVEPISWANLGRARYDLGRYAEAAALADRAVRLARQRGDDVVANQSQLLAARAHAMAGDHARAMALLDDVEARFRRMFPPGHPALAATAIDRARLQLEQGALADAAAQIAAAVALVETHDALASFLPVAIRTRAAVALRQHRYEAARADAERTLALLRAETPAGVTSALVGAVLVLYGESLAGLGRTAEARSAFTEALPQLDDAAGADHPTAVRARRLLAALDRP